MYNIIINIVSLFEWAPNEWYLHGEVIKLRAFGAGSLDGNASL